MAALNCLPSKSRLALGSSVQYPSLRTRPPLCRLGANPVRKQKSPAIGSLQANSFSRDAFFELIFKRSRGGKLRVGRQGAVLAMTWVQLQIGFRPRSNLKEAQCPQWLFSAACVYPGPSPQPPGPPRQPTSKCHIVLWVFSVPSVAAGW